MNKKVLFNILKYSIILEYLINNNSFFIDKYKLLLFNELIKINNNYINLLQLNNNELLTQLNKIIETYYNY